jgi:DHA1 family bicyclomycin/chloramphenicol resistance-like MFS transporter
MSRVRFPFFALLLASLTALNPISIDVMVPAMPAIAEALGAEVALVQYTLAAYLVGIGIGQLFHGPLSDRFGRKPVALAGLALYAAAGAGCALSSSIEMLLGFRAMHGFAACTGMIVGRAIVRDRYERNRAAETLAHISVFHSIAPIGGPILGAWLAVEHGWAWTFWAMAIYAAVVAAIVWRVLPETHLDRTRLPLGPAATLRSFAHIARNRAFQGYLACMAIAYAGMFSYLSTASFVLIRFIGLAPERFGMLSAVIMVGYVVAALAAGRLVHRLGLDGVLVIGIAFTSAAGVAMAVVAWAAEPSAAAIVVPMFFYMVGFGAISPACSAAALQPFPALAGTASSLFGLIQTLTAVAVVAASGLFNDGTQVPMANTIALCALATATGYLLLARRRKDLIQAG